MPDQAQQAQTDIISTVVVQYQEHAGPIRENIVFPYTVAPSVLVRQPMQFESVFAPPIPPARIPDSQYPDVLRSLVTLEKGGTTAPIPGAEGPPLEPRAYYPDFIRRVPVPMPDLPVPFEVPVVAPGDPLLPSQAPVIPFRPHFRAPQSLFFDQPNINTEYDYSRGIYEPYERGIYHTPAVSAAEPHFTVVSVSNQVIPAGAVLTLVDLDTATSYQGFGTSDGDPWSTLVAVSDYVRIKHTGRYIIGFRCSWEDAAAGIRGIFVQAHDAGGVAIRTVVRTILPTAGTGLATIFSGVSDIQPLLAGWRLTVQAQQSSAGDLDLQQLVLWGIRLAPQIPTMPTS